MLKPLVGLSPCEAAGVQLFWHKQELGQASIGDKGEVVLVNTWGKGRSLFY